MLTDATTVYNLLRDDLDVLDDLRTLVGADIDLVCPGTRAVLEGLSTVLEGVHLVPGLVEVPEQHSATVVQVLLAIVDEGRPC